MLFESSESTDLIPPDLIPPDLLPIVLICFAIILIAALIFLFLKYRKLKSSVERENMMGSAMQPPSDDIGRQLAELRRTVVGMDASRKMTEPAAGPALAVNTAAGTASGSLDLNQQLRILLAIHEQVLSTEGIDLYQDPMLFEQYRCTSLISQLLGQVVENTDVRVNVPNAISVLQDVNLLDIDALAALKTKNENAVVVAHVLKQNGFREEETRRAIDLLAHVANTIKAEYNGKIHYDLRNIGSEAGKKYVNLFHTGALDDERLSYAVSRWLQSVCNLPLPSGDRAVAAFCTKNHVTVRDLLTTADELGLNISYVEHMLKVYGDILDQVKLEMSRMPVTAEGKSAGWEDRAIYAINEVLY